MGLGSHFAALLGNDPAERSVQVLNEYDWNLTVEEEAGNWSAYGGDQLIICSEEKGQVDALLQGMALQLLVLPPEFQARLKQWLSETH